jgi:3-isopropylmalate/(R)-2-methylmalate dehydratase small subunit
MPLTKIISISGKAVPVAGADMDTDRIIPARFLKCITFDELAGTMFYDERFNADGSSKGHPIDAPQHAGATIILGGENFGCGSSREHAPQAIKRSGVKAIVAESFAEIFFGNSSGIGMPCVCASHADLEKALSITTKQPETEWTLDLATMTMSCAAATLPVTMPAEPREALMQGRWDAVVELMNAPEAVAALAAKLPAPALS